MKESINKVDIFWTGGLDSTFNLVQLIKTTDQLIQPHYIVRYEDSTGVEIGVMIKIRREILRRFPDARGRLLPTIYINEELIPRFQELDEEIEELRKIGKVREQYQILAHYCKGIFHSLHRFGFNKGELFAYGRNRPV